MKAPPALTSLPEPLEARIAPANLAFAFGLGNSRQQIVDEVATDPAGNTYVTGRFQGLVDFDPGPGVVSRLALGSDVDGFVAKYDGMGALSWVAVVRDSDRGTDPMQLAVSPRGEAYLFSQFGGPNGSVSFTDRPGESRIILDQVGSLANIFVSKLDPSGTFQWVTRFGSTAPAAAQSADLAVDASGGIYLIGKALGGAGPGSLALGSNVVTVEAGEQNLFVAKLQDGAQPSVAWVNQTTSPGAIDTPSDSDLTIATNASGDVVIRGETKVPLTFSGQVLTTTSQSIFAASLSPAGEWRWVNEWAGGTDNRANVAVNPAGEVFVLGDFTGTIDADPSAATSFVTSAGLEDFLLVKLTPLGGFVFAAQFGNAGSNGAGEIAGVDAAGNVHFTGEIGAPGVIDVDPGADSVLVRGARVVIALDGNGGVVGGHSAVPARSATASDSVVVDADGGLHRAGGFAGKFNAGLDAENRTLTSKGTTDFFVARYFPGNLVAQDLNSPLLGARFAIGGAGDQSGGPVLTDAVGNLYLAGTFAGTVDFDPGAGVTNLTSSDPDGNIYVAKYDPTGALVWARAVQLSVTFDTNAPDLGVQLGLDTAGNVYLAGEYDASATLGAFTLTNATPNPTGSSRDVFAAKLDAAGTFQWARSFGAAGQNDFVEAFAVRGSSGTVVLGGGFQGTIDFDPGAGVQNRTALSIGSTDGYLVSLDTAGAFQWVRQLGGAASRTTVESLGFLSGGDVVATGGFSGRIDFALGSSPSPLTSQTTLAGGRDAFAARFAGATGTVAWRDGFGGSTQQTRTQIAISATDEIFVAGRFHGTADFDPSAAVKLLIESGGGAAGNSGGDVFLQKLDATGALLSAVSFGGPGTDRPSAVELDGAGAVYVVGRMGSTIDLDPGPGLARLTGKTDRNFFVARYETGALGFLSGFQIPVSKSAPTGGRGIGIDGNAGAGIHIDATGRTYLSATFAGALDLDPAGAFAPLVSKGARDFVVAQFLPGNVFDAAHPRSFHDANGDLVTLKLTGPGTAAYTLVGGAGDFADLASLQLTDTRLATAVSIRVARFGSGDGATVVQKVLTTQTNQHLGTITFGPQITLGDGLADTVVDLRVSGALKGLKLRELAANAILRLGEDLPYDVADAKVPDTKNNLPSFLIGRVLGPGVQLVVLGKDAPLDGPNAGQGTVQGPGGGGLANLIVGSWAFPGFIRTTQSIGNLNVLTDDFYGVLEIDKFRVGTTTTANVGTMTVEQGAWGSSGSEIEGAVAAFNAEAFLAGAQITAASIGSVTTTTSSFDGTLILTDPDSNAVPAFTVTTDFTGSVVSASSIRRLIIKGDFTGALQAPSIGSIKAFSFLGTKDLMGVPTSQIEATLGSLGTLTATAGVVKDYKIVTDTAFKGFKVRLTNLTEDTIGIDNVQITAASIGPITVSLATKARAAAGVDLIGIRNSSFVTTATGTTPATAGTIGKIAVTLTGGAGGGSATGLQDVTFDALVGTVQAPTSTHNTIGNIAVRINGQDGATLGLDNVIVAANSVGSTRVTVNRGASLTATASAIDRADFTATKAIGALTIGGNATAPQVQDLQVWAGGNVGAISVKATIAEHGTLAASAILAGQSLVLTGATAAEQLAALGLARLGAVTLSGSLSSADLIAGGSIGAVTAGGSMTGSRILAGAMLGGDFAIDGDETYQRAASIAAITVKGAFTATSISAGVNPGNAIFGDNDDTAAAAPSLVPQTSSIGPISLSAATLATPSGSFTFGYAIQAATLTGLKLGGTPAILDGSPRFLNQTNAGEDASDVIVRLIS